MRRTLVGMNSRLASLLMPALSILFGASLSYASAESGLTYHGRILKPDGTPLEGEIKFLIQIRSPSDQGDCLLYEETQVTKVNKGVFSLTLGKADFRSDNLTHSFEDVFRSNVTLTGLTCSGNAAQTTYKAASTHGRQLKVSFFDVETGWEELPPTSVNFVPLAIESQTVGGFSPKHLLRVVENGEPKEIDPLTETQYNNLIDLINGIIGGGGGGGSGTVTNVTALSPLLVTDGSTTPQISIPKASATQDGYLSKEDWQAFSAKQPAGNYITALTGDVTAVGPGSAVATLTDGAVKTSKIEDKAVTLEKIQDIAAGSLLGRSSGGSGAVEVISIGSGLSLSGGVLSATGSGGSGGVASVSSANSYIQVQGTATDPVLQLNVGTTAGTVAAGDDSRITGALQRSGGTMSGLLDMGGHDILNAGNIVLSDSKHLKLGSFAADPDTSGWGANEKGRTWFNTTENQIKYWDGSSIQVLTAANGTVTAVTADPPLVSSGGVSPTISIPQADGATNGYLSSSDWSEFKSKLGAVTDEASLAQGKVWIGDGSGKAQEQSLTGDVQLLSNGQATVQGLQGKSIIGAANAAGQVLRYDGTNAWVPGFLSLTDIRSVNSPYNPVFPGTSCSASQTLTWSSLTDTFTCTDITLDASRITTGTLDIARIPVGTGAGTVAAGNDSRFPSSACGSGNLMRWDGNTWVCEPVQAGGGASWISETVSSGNLAITPADNNKFYRANGDVIFDLPEASAAGSGFQVSFVNVGSGGVLIQPTGSDRINEERAVSLVSKHAVLTLMSDGTHWITVNYSGNVAFGCTADKQVITFTGNVQNIQVPPGCYTMTVKAWGGGGGGGQTDGAAGGPGGGGAFASSTLDVMPFETLQAYVGGGGKRGTKAANSPGGAGGFNGGANGGNSGPSGGSGSGGGGGGFSAIMRGSNILIAAGGGGGGGGGGKYNTAGAGGGGGMDGGAASGVPGGVAGASPTTSGLPGMSRTSGDGGGAGGGGGGVKGGGGGSAPTSGDYGAAGGGGGTSLGDIVQNGSGTTPGNASDPDRNGAGNGGAIGGDGANGIIVITWGS